MAGDYKYTDGEELYYGPVQDFDLFLCKNYNHFEAVLKQHHIDATVKAKRLCWGYIIDGKRMLKEEMMMR